MRILHTSQFSPPLSSGKVPTTGPFDTRATRFRKVPPGGNFFLDSAARVALRCARSAARLPRSRAPSRAGPARGETRDWHARCFSFLRLRAARRRERQSAPRDGFASQRHAPPDGSDAPPNRHATRTSIRHVSTAGAPARGRRPVSFGSGQWSVVGGQNARTPRLAFALCFLPLLTAHFPLTTPPRGGVTTGPRDTAGTCAPTVRTRGAIRSGAARARVPTRTPNPIHDADEQRIQESAVRNALVVSNGNRHRAGSHAARPRGADAAVAPRGRCATPTGPQGGVTCPRARALRGSRRSRC
jgi:hypothetical protein